MCEDIARQMITYGRRKSAEEMCAEIDAVTARDIMDLAQSLIRREPAVSVVGEKLSGVLKYSAISDVLASYRKELKNKGYLQ